MLASVRIPFVSAMGVLLLMSLGAPPGGRPAHGAEPPAINPFGPVRHEREDAIPGYVEMSDGKVYPGAIYLTRDKRLKVYDETLKRQREVPLRVVKQIQCKVLKEWMEKEWRFKETTKAEKYYTGRQYPSREYAHTITLQDDRTISGPLAEIVFVKPYADPTATGHRPQEETKRLFLQKRNKGDLGTNLKSLFYVRLVKLGEEALEEGRRKAARYRPEKSTSADPKTSTADKSP